MKKFDQRSKQCRKQCHQTAKGEINMLRKNIVDVFWLRCYGQACVLVPIKEISCIYYKHMSATRTRSHERNITAQ